MGLISTALTSVGGVVGSFASSVSSTLADQWKEYFYCDSIANDILVVKGQKRVSGKSVNKGTDNVISNGSIIAVADGQCMIIVEQGKVVELCAEPGEFKYDTTLAPSIFAGSLGSSVLDTFKEIGKRFVAGGQVTTDQRVYYFNTKEITGNKYGTPNAVPFRVVDRNIGLDIDVSIKCFGEYSYKITNPILFYTNVCGNVASAYTRSQIDSQLKTELLTALQPAFADISEQGIRYSALPGHTMEMSASLNKVLSAKWANLRGIEVVEFGVSSVKADEEDEKMIKELQRNATFRDPTMAAAHLVGAQANAMQDAAKNPNGAFNAFMGVNAAQNSTGINATQLFAMNQQAQQPAAQAAPAAPAAPSNAWTCPSCGTKATGKFCPECGAQKPADPNTWTCPTCGTSNKGKFCAECGTKKPAGALVYKCDKCGWEPEDPAHPPKFCPECGDLFNDDDIVK